MFRKEYSRIQELHKKWHKELQDIILTMNQYFISYVREDNNSASRSKSSLGEISLEPNILPNSIPAKYILFIYYYFYCRNYESFMNSYQLHIRAMLKSFDRVRDLTSQSLSGGEKSFSTSLLILSMRSLIHAPFCVMDEVYYYLLYCFFFVC